MNVWRKVANDPNLFPVKGDIVFFDKTSYNKYGHVAVCDSADAKQLTVIEQN